MKKRILTAVVLLTLAVVSLTACADKVPETVQSKLEDKKEDVENKATAEIKQAFVAQIKDFLQSDDLQASLGLTDEQMTEVEQSVEQYIEDYEFDTESLTKMVDELKGLFNQAQDLSQEDIQKKLDEILKK